MSRSPFRKKTRWRSAPAERWVKSAWQHRSSVSRHAEKERNPRKGSHRTYQECPRSRKYAVSRQSVPEFPEFPGVPRSSPRSGKNEGLGSSRPQSSRSTRNISQHRVASEILSRCSYLDQQAQGRCLACQIANTSYRTHPPHKVDVAGRLCRPEVLRS